MYTSILMFALSGVAPSAMTSETPAWLTDYYAASKQGESSRKPIAVFIGSGKAGWDKLSQDGGLSNGAKDLLVSKYVCLYIDTNTADGLKLAQSFEIPNGLGIVISDRTGKHQAFRHEGDLSSSLLDKYLRRYGDPNRVFRVTESNPSHAPAYYYQAPSFCPTCPGGGCPGGNCGR